MASRCADKLRVLSDSNRLGILRALMNGALHVGEINALVPIDQSLLSHHLKVLRDAGFVHSERDGKARLYSLTSEVVLGRQKKGIHLGCCEISFGDEFLKGEA